MRQQKPKRKQVPAAKRRAIAAASLSPAQLRFTPAQAQVMLAIANTHFWKEVGDGRLKIYADGKKRYVTRVELERYEAARRGPA